MLNGTMGLLVVGAAWLGWGLTDFSTAMLGMGLAAGLAGGLGAAGTARGLAEGFRRMAYAAVLVGVARAVLVVLQDGQVLDTLALHPPTAGSFLAMLAIANVSFGRWFRFMLPAFAGLLLIGAVAIAIGVRTGV